MARSPYQTYASYFLPLPVPAPLFRFAKILKIETKEYKMTKINLRKYYPDFYTTDYTVEVPDEVAALMDSYEHTEAAYYLRRYRHRAYYSLDRGDGYLEGGGLVLQIS